MIFFSSDFFSSDIFSSDFCSSQLAQTDRRKDRRRRIRAHRAWAQVGSINRVYNIIVPMYSQIVSTFSASVLSALSASSTVSALMSVHSNSNKSSRRCPSWKCEIDKGFFLKSLINVRKITLANVFWMHWPFESCTIHTTI